MGKITTSLIGAALFVFGLMKMSGATHMIVDQSAMMFGLVLVLAGGLLLAR